MLTTQELQENILKPVMSYPEFTDALCASLNKHLKKIGYGVCMEVRDGYLGDKVHFKSYKQENRYVNRMPVRDFYFLHCAGMAYSEILDLVIKESGETISAQEGVFNNGKVPSIDDYNAIKSHFFIRLVPLHVIEMDKDHDSYVYKTFADMALVAYAYMGLHDDQFVSSKIVATLLKKWDITPEDMFEKALENSPKLFPPRLGVGMCDFEGLKDSARHDPMRPDFVLSKSPTYQLTTSAGTNGAAAIFYPGMMKRIRKLMRQEYYVVPLSIHAMVLHPASAIRDVRSIKSDMTADIWKDQLFLSTSVFKYDSANDKLEQV